MLMGRTMQHIFAPPSIARLTSFSIAPILGALSRIAETFRLTPKFTLVF